MASAMNYINATLDKGDGTEPEGGLHVVVRNNMATASKTGHAGETKSGVVAVTRSGLRQATVTFTDGTVWLVSAPDRAKGGCGCGG